jgi:Gas vesicle synthesis protein GvpO
MALDEDTAQRRRESVNRAGPSVNRAGPAERRTADDHGPSTPSGDNDLLDEGRSAPDGSRGAALIGRRAARLVTTLSGRRSESVISIERTGDGWRVGVEVVEMSRIPNSEDILAVYDVRLDADGDLVSYQRIRRYARGRPGREHCR